MTSKLQRSESVYNLYEAKTALSRLVDRAAAGEEIVIAKAGIPMARLVPVARKTAKRQPGGWEGQLTIGEDFDDELPADLLDPFSGDG